MDSQGMEHIESQNCDEFKSGGQGTQNVRTGVTFRGANVQNR